MTEFVNDALAEIESEPDVYCLMNDDDGHWYVILVDDEKNFHTWVEDTCNDRDSEYDFDECRIGGHPSLVKFTHYWIE